MKESRKKRMSAGTTLMLVFTVLILAGTAFVLARIGSGASSTDAVRVQPETAGTRVSGPLQEENNTMSDEPPEIPEPSPAAEQTAEPVAQQNKKRFTLTVAGTVALSGEVRKNSYFSDVKQYDYYDTMMLLKKEITGDLNVVFLENLVSNDGKASDLTAAGAAAAMLKNAGFNTAACGFAKAYDKAESGIAETRKNLLDQGILPVGIFEEGADGPFCITEKNGIRVALMQYTDTIAAGTRKNMVKQNTSSLVPPADGKTIAADIARAREQGAELVAVLLNWGKTGKAPDKAMRLLAQEIADSGADLIIGNGNRIVSGAEMLTARDSGKQVLCVWSLGTVLSGDRSNIRRIAGMVLHADVYSENGQAAIRNYRYTPIYTWKYKQDGRFQYRCMAADGTVPDGMDSEQQKMMKKAAETVRTAMKGSPVEERANE